MIYKTNLFSESFMCAPANYMQIGQGRVNPAVFVGDQQSALLCAGHSVYLWYLFYL